MYQIKTNVFGILLLSLGLSAMAQDRAPAQLTPVPPKPTCTPFLKSGACADLWRNYSQALAQRQREELQLYVNRQNKLASEAATAPLQQQIADLNKLTADQQAQIKKLQDQMQADAALKTALEAKQADTDAALKAVLEAKQADAAVALEAKSTAHREGLRRGVAIGAGATLLLFVVIFGVRRLTRTFTVTKKSQATSA